MTKKELCLELYEANDNAENDGINCRRFLCCQCSKCPLKKECEKSYGKLKSYVIETAERIIKLRSIREILK